MSKQERHLFEFGPFRLDEGERVLLRRGELVPLTPKAFETLLVLVRSSGHVVSKDELMKEVWPDTFVEENGLARNISVLRKSLGGGPADNAYIETVPKRGYRFVAPVREVSDAGGVAPAPPEPGAQLVWERQTVARVVSEEEEETAGRGEVPAAVEMRVLPPGRAGRGRPSLRRSLGLILACATLVGLGYALFYFSNRKGNEAGAGVNSIAVLPFRSVAPAGGDDYLGLGMADALITKLSNLRQVAVRPTSAVRRYARLESDPQAAGRELGVGSVLEGSLQREDGRVRVTVRLINVRDGRPLWAGAFDENYTDIFTLQDSIAEKVGAALKVQITAAERERLYRRYTNDVAAYELYARGRSRLLPYTREDALAAVEAFEGALKLDANYALAHAGLALACATMRARFAPEAEVRGWEERAKREANRALELDPGLAEAHEALAAVYRYTDFDWEHTIEESRRALELNPNLELPHHYLAAAYYHLGLLEAVEEEARAGLQANPGNRFEPLRMRGMAAFHGGRFAEAVALLEEAKRTRETTVSDWHLAQAYYYQGERGLSERMLEELSASRSAEEHARGSASLASFLAARGERARAEALLRDVEAGTYMDHHAAYSIGATYAQLGDHGRAVKWLARAAATGLPCYPWYERDPLLAPLGGDPEFQRFMAGLRSSWEAAKKR